MWAKRPSFRAIVWLMVSSQCHACLSPVSCKEHFFIDSDSTAGLRSQHQTEIYGACEQLVGLGSAMHGCNSRGLLLRQRGPCCGLVWQQRSRTELARGRHREAKALQSAAPLLMCWVCVLHHHTASTEHRLCLPTLVYCFTWSWCFLRFSVKTSVKSSNDDSCWHIKSSLMMFEHKLDASRRLLQSEKFLLPRFHKNFSEPLWINMHSAAQWSC